MLYRFEKEIQPIAAYLSAESNEILQNYILKTQNL